MINLSVRVNKTKIMVVTACVLFVVTVSFIFFGISDSDKVVLTAVEMNTTQDRLEFLEELGWQVQPESESIVQVQIPQVFDDVLKKYNKIQIDQGYNLEKYAGKTLTRFTYTIKNYPDEPEGVVVNIYQYENYIVSGDISSLKLTGFMHGIVSISEIKII